MEMPTTILAGHLADRSLPANLVKRGEGQCGTYSIVAALYNGQWSHAYTVTARDHSRHHMHSYHAADPYGSSPDDSLLASANL